MCVCVCDCSHFYKCKWAKFLAELGVISFALFVAPSREQASKRICSSFSQTCLLSYVCVRVYSCVCVCLSVLHPLSISPYHQFYLHDTSHPTALRSPSLSTAPSLSDFLLFTLSHPPLVWLSACLCGHLTNVFICLSVPSSSDQLLARRPAKCPFASANGKCWNRAKN